MATRVQPPRRAKEKGKHLTRALADECGGDGRASARVARDDTQSFPWLHLKDGRGSTRGVGRLAARGKGRPRALSPPFYQDDQLVHEIKWFGFDDDAYTLLPYTEVLHLFSKDEPFMMWISYWWSRIVTADVRQGMRQHLERLPVALLSCFFVCCCSDMAGPWDRSSRSIPWCPLSTSNGVCCRMNGGAIQSFCWKRCRHIGGEAARNHARQKLCRARWTAAGCGEREP